MSDEPPQQQHGLFVIVPEYHYHHSWEPSETSEPSKEHRAHGGRFFAFCDAEHQDLGENTKGRAIACVSPGAALSPSTADREPHALDPTSLPELWQWTDYEEPREHRVHGGRFFLILSPAWSSKPARFAADQASPKVIMDALTGII